MGIQGLLPLLSPIHTLSHLSQLKGQTVGGEIKLSSFCKLSHRLQVDAYVWLHKGAFGCAMELAQGIPTKK